METLMKFKKSLPDIVRKENGQIALILAFVFLAVLGTIGISFLYRMRLEERAVRNYQDSLKADYLAQAGIERAIAELRNDTNEYDDLYEPWARGFKESLGEGNYEVSEAENPGKNEKSERLGIFDEASRINLNAVGAGKHHEGWTPWEINLGAITAINRQLGSDGIDNDEDGCVDEENEGAQAIIKYRYGEDGAPGVKGADDDQDRTVLQADGIDNDGDGEIDEPDEGVDEPDEFCPDRPYGDDNPFNTVEEIRLIPGIGDKTFNKIKDYLTIYSYDKNVDKEGNLRININTASSFKISQTLQRVGIFPEVADQIAANVVDFRDPDNRPTECNGKYGLERTPYINEIMPHFTTSVPMAVVGLAKGGVRFLEEKIKEKVKEKIDEKMKIDSSPLLEEVKKGTSEKERELKIELDKIIKKYESEEEGKRHTSVIFRLMGEKVARAAETKEVKADIEIEWIELSKPYDDSSCKIGGWKIKTSLGTKRLWGTMAGRSFKLVFNMVIRMEGKTIGREILDDYADTVILKNKQGDIVDKVSYRNYGLPWNAFEKNDPRVREFVSSLPGGSPRFRNWFWMPDVGEGKDKDDYSSFYVKNKPFANIGEVGFIHCGKQWRTIRLTQGGDWKILDKITVAEPPQLPVRGRININTAPKKVLEALPGIDSSLTKAIINYGDRKGPFNEVGEILEILLIEKLGSNEKDDDGDGYVDEEDENEAIFRMLSNLITTRSNCFTIVSQGKMVRSEEVVAEKKLKIVVDRGSSPIKIRYYRELPKD
jgi:type II secretory pathway component PulK